MAPDLLENETVQLAATALAAAGAINWGLIGFADTNVLVDTLELTGDNLTYAYGAIGAGGVVKANELLEGHLD